MKFLYLVGGKLVEEQLQNQRGQMTVRNPSKHNPQLRNNLVHRIKYSSDWIKTYLQSRVSKSWFIWQIFSVLYVCLFEHLQEQESEAVHPGEGGINRSKFNLESSFYISWQVKNIIWPFHFPLLLRDESGPSLFQPEESSSTGQTWVCVSHQCSVCCATYIRGEQHSRVEQIKPDLNTAKKRLRDKVQVNKHRVRNMHSFTHSSASL